jgi:hypothetical protein
MRIVLPLIILSLLLQAACNSEPPAEEFDDERREPTLEFFADMVPEEVVSAPPDTTAAHGVAQARLMGSRLVIEGAFNALSSPPLAEADDSGVHIHPGTAGQELEHLYVLHVELEDDDDGLSGTFHGDFFLEPEKVDLLRQGRLYVDIHTEEHTQGELRGQLLLVEQERVRGVADADAAPRPPLAPVARHRSGGS